MRSVAPSLCALLGSALLLLLGMRLARAQTAAEQCDLSCPIGQRCDDAGRCVAQAEEAAQPVYVTPAGGFADDDPTVHTHDGFMLRLTLGLGAGFFGEEETMPAVSLSDGDPGAAMRRLDFTGVALAGSLDIGWSLGERFALHVRFGEFLLPSAAREASGDGEPRPGEEPRSALLSGPALSYFVLPANAYVTLAVGPVLWRGDDYDGDKSPGDLGIGFNLDLGLEFWVGEQWGMGAALRAFALVAQGDARPRGEVDISGWSPELLFSLTYH